MPIKIKSIQNALKAYDKNELERQGGWGVNKFRIAGYLEACLEHYGFIAPGAKLEFKTVTKVEPIFPWLPINVTKKYTEGYSEHIVRLTREFLDQEVKK